MLESLALDQCNQIADISALGSCVRLRRFWSTSTRRLGGIHALTRDLQYLKLCCVSAADIATIGTFPNLLQIWLYQGENFMSSLGGDGLACIAKCARLEILKLSGFGIAELLSLTRCPNLKVLRLDMCICTMDVPVPLIGAGGQTITVMMG